MFNIVNQIFLLFLLNEEIFITISFYYVLSFIIIYIFILIIQDFLNSKNILKIKTITFKEYLLKNLFFCKKTITLKKKEKKIYIYSIYLKFIFFFKYIIKKYIKKIFDIFLKKKNIIIILILKIIFNCLKIYKQLNIITKKIINLKKKYNILILVKLLKKIEIYKKKYILGKILLFAFVNIKF